MKAFFESLQIGAVDAWTLFTSLDKDGDHTISVEEFTERSMQLYGPAKSADLYALRQLTAAGLRARGVWWVWVAFLVVSNRFVGRPRAFSCPDPVGEAHGAAG